MSPATHQDTQSPNYEVKTGVGKVIYTSPHIDLAKRWAKSASDTFGLLTIEAVTVIEHRHRVWTARPKRVLEVVS